MSISKYLISIIAFCIFLISTGTQASINIEVLALFKDKAMVLINKEQRLLKVGEPTELGVTLIESTSKYAILDVNGKQSRYTLGNRVQTDFDQQDKKKILIYRSTNGMFKTTGSINGYTVDFLIDTGASAIAISSNLARRLGIQYKLTGKSTLISTASGTEYAYAVKFDRVKVGEIMLRNVNGIVLDGNEPKLPLLGMSYLGRLNMINEGQVMKLEEKY